jgi:UDP-3-O-[3-hydroxymyristoyl] glucosamine N-acyltransferase
VVDATATIPASCSVAPLVVIGENVVLGEHVIIGAGCVIENNVTIADNTHLEPHVVIKHDCEIGPNCHLFSGAVIGSDGFGYAEESGVWLKIPQVGRVVIHANVDIGANTTIDRGALDDTIIEEGVKLDNLIQIGHNCIIGAHTVIAGATGIAGSAKIGRHCKIGGAAMILGHLTIADHVTISPGSMITRSLAKADTYTALMPFQTHKAWLNTAAKIRHLDSLSAQIKNLEKELALLKSY